MVYSHSFEQLEIQNKPKRFKTNPRNQFPLLKLPRVVLLECIENLDVLEIILFSLISKRAKTIAKLVHWSPLDIHLGTECGPQIVLKCYTDPDNEWVIEYNEDREPSEYPYFDSEETDLTVLHYLFLNDNGNAIEDSKQMTAHICEVFRSPISGIDLCEESEIEWIIKFQPTLRNVWIWDDAITSVETLDHTFKNLKVTNYFYLESVSTVEKFQYKEPIPARFLSIRNSYWLTLPSILNGTNSCVRLQDSKLTPKDINTLLKKWQMGLKLRTLEYLEIKSFTPLDVESFTNEALKDLVWTNGDENDGRPTNVEIDDDSTYTLPEVQTVKNLIRNDGMIGSIFEVFEDDNMELCFSFQVWSKQI
ncbi:hypothetical protein B9Z55_022465 [Caenorhabditis nigoni]|nr:hypothetical protein B9Z55_022465 [Caenorhabditis nigoni]